MRRFTLWFVPVLLVMLISATAIQAQTDYSYRSASTYVTVGAGFGAGASISLQEPDVGSKIGPVFAYRAGVIGTYPLSKLVSVTLNLDMDSRGLKVRNESDENIYTKTNLRYFSITPGIRLSSFWLGLNIGLPMGGSTAARAGSATQEVSADFSDASMDQVSSMLEGRIGVAIPVVDKQEWMIVLNFNVGYCFNNMFKDAAVGGGVGTFNGPLTSAHLGFSFQYAIPGTGRK